MVRISKRGLGEKFIRNLEERLDIVREFPESSPLIYKNIQRIILGKFPDLVFYIVTQSQITVLAIMHAFRDPTKWPR